MSAQPDLPREFDIDVAVAGRRTVVSVRGAVDVGTAPILRGALATVHDHACRDRVHAPLVMDLAGVTFIDASGLHVLVGAAGRAHREGRAVVLLDPSPITLRVLEITRLLDVFLVDWPCKEVNDRQSGEVSGPARNVA